MKGRNFGSQVLSRHTFRISRKKGSDFCDHKGTLNNISLEDFEIDQDNMFPLGRLFVTVTCLLVIQCS